MSCVDFVLVTSAMIDYFQSVCKIVKSAEKGYDCMINFKRMYVKLVVTLSREDHKTLISCNSKSPGPSWERRLEHRGTSHDKWGTSERYSHRNT